MLRDTLKGPKARRRQYTKLSRKFVLLTVICSVLPLLIVGWVINVNYSGFATERTEETFRNQVSHHRNTIELFLSERLSAIQLLARTHSLDQLREAGNLEHVFNIINEQYGNAFTDLGVIGGNGDHLAYVGPYDLLDRNYVNEFWFHEVMTKGVYVSDMFLGFRRVPHFIVAVHRLENGQSWILRATIDTEALRSLVENVRVGQTGEVFLLNESGLFQTTPRFGGAIMEQATIAVGEPHDGIEVRTPDSGDEAYPGGESEQIIADAWLSNPRWMLVVKQDYSEAFQGVAHINWATAALLHLSAIAILLVSVFTAKHMISVIKKRDEDAEQMNKQLLQANKMASLGELSAGVAHEINNPMAIIMTERQILLDLAAWTPELDPDFKARMEKSLRQIDLELHRCRQVTHGLLKFARRTMPERRRVDLNELLMDIVSLMEREAINSGVQFTTDLDELLEPILVDASELQQVFLNLTTNAIDAHEGKRDGRIHFETRLDGTGRVRVTVRDTGCGIDSENLDRVIEPFFTTKPVGKGTGLGLSICYSIIKQMGGELSIHSDGLGKGSAFVIHLPCDDQQQPPEKMEDAHDQPEDPSGRR